jgi:hypothetical protein
MINAVYYQLVMKRKIVNYPRMVSRNHWTKSRKIVDCIYGLLIAGLLSSAVGCSRTPEPVPSSTADTSTSRLTPAQADAQIKEVESNTKIPENVKPQIIASIRAQVGK